MPHRVFKLQPQLDLRPAYLQLAVPKSYLEQRKARCQSK